MNKFWIVLRDKGETYVTKRHGSLQSAKEEAERLSRKEGVRFFVAEVFGCVEPADFPLKWSTLDYQSPDDDITF